MKFLFVTYRWGEDLLGGAEIHHRRLAQELLDLGHEVAVVTSDGHQMRNFCHWAVEWDRLTPSTPSSTIPVHRVAMGSRPRWLLAVGAKWLQKEMEDEEFTPLPLVEAVLSRTTPDDEVYLLNGFHHPELMDGKPHRWTTAKFAIAVNSTVAGKQEVVLRGSVVKKITLTSPLGAEYHLKPGNLELPVAVELAAGLNVLPFTLYPIWRPLREVRSLGLLLNGVELRRPGNNSTWADPWSDLRSLGRQVPHLWQKHLLDRAQTRPGYLGRLFDFLRGPSSNLAAALQKFPGWIAIHCNLPWGNMSAIREGDLAMPLWHIEDDFYYWQHWIDALRRSRFVLSNTPFTEKEFFPRLDIPAKFVGPPVWEPAHAPDPGSVAGWRERQGIPPDRILVLTVCRKSAEKRYDAIAAAVERLGDEGLPVFFAGVGPDIDQRRFAFRHAKWLGRMDDPELQLAYAAADIFVLMSESESFGMVIPEAWHHGKPVVVNRLCAPSASLVEDGHDGLLAMPGSELEAALRKLVADPALRNRLGTAGQAKARAHYVRGAAGKRLLAALAEIPDRA